MELKAAIKVLSEIKASIVNKAVENLAKPVRLNYDNKDIKSKLTADKVKGYSVNYDNDKTAVQFRRNYCNKMFRQYQNLTTEEHTKIVSYVEEKELQQELNIWVSSALREHKAELL